MAFFNEIGAGRYNRFLQKLFNMKGGPPSRQLASDITPVFPFFSGAEHRFLEMWDRFGLTAAFTGAAAQFSAIRMRNPSNSNLVAVFEKIFVSSTAADAMNIDLSSVALDLTGSAVVSQRFDPRGKPKTGLIGTSQTTLVAAITPTIAVIPLQASGVGVDAIVTDIQELTLLPGDALSCGINLAAAVTQVTFWWRERYLEESERLTS